jgi:hypothetical protein
LSTEREGRLEQLVEAVLAGEAGALEALGRHLSEHRGDLGSLRLRAREGIEATGEELDDLLRQLRRGGDVRPAQADAVLRRRHRWWEVLAACRRARRGR